MGAGSKTQIRGIPGADDHEANVTGRALWVTLAGMASSGAVINVNIVGSDVEGSPQLLNGGSGVGRPIELDNTTPVTLHTVPSGSRDQVRLYASNTSTIDTFVVLRLGGTSSDEITVFCPARETVPILDEHMMDEGEEIDATIAAGSAAEVKVYGDVNRFTP